MNSALIQCSDFLKFQDALKTMREIDDKIVYALNAIVPTESFKSQINPSSKCQELYQKLDDGHENRTKVLTNCITVTAENLKHLKEQYEKDNEDIQLSKKLKEEKTKLRLLQTELSVEEVVKQRSDKVFYEKCRMYYTPTKLAE